jgi:protease PrsW
LLIVLVYENSERSLRSWLSMGMDEDMTMLEMILTGRTSVSRFGQYLHSIRDFFPPTVVIDLLCYLRIYLELAIHAKGLLLLRQYGMEQEIDPAIKEKFVEFKYLEKSIGKTGKLALGPFMRLDDRALWQLYMLGDTGSHSN